MYMTNRENNPSVAVMNAVCLLCDIPQWNCSLVFQLLTRGRRHWHWMKHVKFHRVDSLAKLMFVYYQFTRQMRKSICILACRDLALVVTVQFTDGDGISVRYALNFLMDDVAISELVD